MELKLERTYSNDHYTIGHLYANGEYLCDTIEDTDRGLDANMRLEEIKAKKVFRETAIPTGKYKVTLSVLSPKFYGKDYYRKFCKGFLPRLLDVPGFDGILMHRGVNQYSSAGCIILGYNKIKGQVMQSQQAFEKVYRKLKYAADLGETITITITRQYKR